MTVYSDNNDTYIDTARRLRHRQDPGGENDGMFTQMFMQLARRLTLGAATQKNAPFVPAHGPAFPSPFWCPFFMFFFPPSRVSSPE